MNPMLGRAAESLRRIGRNALHARPARITDVDIARIIEALKEATHESKVSREVVDFMRERNAPNTVSVYPDTSGDTFLIDAEDVPASGMKWAPRIVAAHGSATKDGKRVLVCPACTSEPEPDGFGPSSLRKCSNRDCHSEMMLEQGGEWIKPTEREKAGYLAHKGTRVFAAIQDHLAEQSKIPATLPFQGGRMLSRIDFDVSDAEVQRQINERFDLLFRMVGDLYQR